MQKVLASSLLFFAACAAHAATGEPTSLDQVASADAVVTGRIISVQADVSDASQTVQRHMVMEVSEQFKGGVSRELRAYIPLDLQVAVGDQVLVHADWVTDHWQVDQGDVWTKRIDPWGRSVARSPEHTAIAPVQEVLWDEALRAAQSLCLILANPNL